MSLWENYIKNHVIYSTAYCSNTSKINSNAWLTTKKRGRDDDKIEIARKKAEENRRKCIASQRQKKEQKLKSLAKKQKTKNRKRYEISSGLEDLIVGHNEIEVEESSSSEEENVEIEVEESSSLEEENVETEVEESSSSEEETFFAPQTKKRSVVTKLTMQTLLNHQIGDKNKSMRKRNRVKPSFDQAGFFPIIFLLH